MNDFLDGLSKKVSETAETVGRKTNDFITVQGLKNQKHKAQNAIAENLTEIGRVICRQYREGAEVSEDAKALCEEIDKLREQIEQLNQRINGYGDTTE